MLFQKAHSISSVMQTCLKYRYCRTEVEFYYWLLDVSWCEAKFWLWISSIASTCTILSIQYKDYRSLCILHFPSLWMMFNYKEYFKSVPLAKKQTKTIQTKYDFLITSLHFEFKSLGASPEKSPKITNISIAVRLRDYCSY